MADPSAPTASPEAGASGSEEGLPGEPATGAEAEAALAVAVQALERQVAELRERLARARADYENLHKRVARDAALERDRARARVLEGLLGLHELARMAAHQAQAHPGPVSEGVVLLAREFTRLLEREGLTAVDAVGVPFDAAVHEAVATEAAGGVAPGHVARVIQPGYRLEGKVLRYAKVAVAPAAPDPSGSVPGDGTDGTDAAPSPAGPA